MRAGRAEVDDRAVSQVLGIVLLVTITVVLASVIGSTALGMGDRAEAAPTANFEVSYDEAADELTVRHADGHDVSAAELYVRGTSIDGSDAGNWVDAANGDATGTVDGNQAVVSGDAATISVTGEDYVLRVIWRSSQTDTTAELTVDQGPAA